MSSGMQKLLLGLILALGFFWQPQPALADSDRQPLIQFQPKIHLTEPVAGDAILVGGEVVVDATVSGDLLVAAGTVDINGQVKDDLRIIAGQIRLNGQVADNVTLAAGQIRVGDQTAVNGDLSLFAPATDSVYISQKTRLDGQLVQNFFPPKPAKPKPTVFLLVVLQQLTTVIIELLFGWLLLALLPRLAKKLVNFSRQNSGQAIGWGFLTVILAPIFGVLLTISLIGIPLAVTTFLLLVISLYLAKLIAGLFLGSRLLQDDRLQKPYLGLATGLVMITLMKLIPVFGWLAYLILILLGLGTLTLAGKTALKNLKK